MKITFFEVLGDPARTAACTALRVGDGSLGLAPDRYCNTATRDMVVTISGQDFRLAPAPGNGVWQGWVSPGHRRQREIRFAELQRADGMRSEIRRIVLLHGELNRGEAIEDIQPVAGHDIGAQEGLVCFTAGARILTAFGDRPVEELAVGDLIHTADNGLQPIRWIGRRDLSPARLQTIPGVAPVRIARDAFGPGLPFTDILVSPQHRMLLEDGDTGAVLAPACALINGRSVTEHRGNHGISYIHLLFDQHEIVFVEGTPTESFYPTPAAMQSLDEAARAALFAAAPQLAHHPLCFGPTVRPVLGGGAAGILAA